MAFSKPSVVACIGPRCENDELIDALWECYRHMTKTKVYKNELYCDGCGWKAGKHEPDCYLGRMEKLLSGGGST